jgi:hypothetical protein
LPSRVPHASIPDTETSPFLNSNPIPADQSLTVCTVTLLSDLSCSQNRCRHPDGGWSLPSFDAMLMHTSAGDRTVASVRTIQVPKPRKLQRSCNDTYVVTVDAMLLVLRKSYDLGSFLIQSICQSLIRASVLRPHVRHCLVLIPASRRTFLSL